MVDSGIGSGKYRRRHPPSSVVDIVFDCGGAPSSSNRGHCRRGIVVNLLLLPSQGGAPLDPDGVNVEDDDDRYRKHCATGMWALHRGMSTITTTPMRRRSQAGLRRRR